MTTYTNSNNNNPTSFDWTQLIAQALLECSQEFLQVINSADPALDETQLQADEDKAHRRYVQALAAAKQDRTNPGPKFLSALRNWSREQATGILRKKKAGKQIRRDFNQLFQHDLEQQIDDALTEIQAFWEEEEKRRQVNKRTQEERAFGSAHPYILGLHDAILDGEYQRQIIFNDGQNAAQQWADKYGDSVKEREQVLEEREKRIRERETMDHEHQRAMRALMMDDQRISVFDTAIRTGKNTLGCLIIWFLLFVGVFLAIYLAFPHH